MTRLPTGYDVSVSGYQTPAPAVNSNLGLVSEALQNIAGGVSVYASNVSNRLRTEAYMERQRQAEADRQAAIEEANAEKIARQDAAVARDLAIQDLADLLPKIEKGEANYVVPDGPLGPWANAQIEAATQGLSDAAKGSYREYTLPKLLESANKQRENLKKAADASTIESVKRVAGTAQSPAEMDTFTQTLIDAGMSPDQARAEVGVKSLQAAVDAMDKGRFDAVAKWLGPDGPERDTINRERVNLESRIETATSKRKAEATAKANKLKDDAVAYLSGLTEAAKNPDSGQTYEGLTQAIENLRPALGDALANEKLAEVRNVISKAQETQIASAQEQSANQLFVLAEIGGLTSDELKSNYLPRTLLPKSDPNYLSPEQYRVIDGRIKDQKVESESAIKVASALSGAPTVLTADDSSEYTKALKKANVIDQNGAVTNPTLLAAASASTNFLPAGVVDTVQNSIRSSDPTIAGNGIEAAGLLAASDEAFYAKLASGLPEGEASIVAASAQWARDGLYSTPEGRQRVAADLAVLRQRVADLKDITREERSKIAQALKDKFAKDTPVEKILDKELTRLFEEERSRVGYTKDPGWIVDLDPDPTLDLTGPGVMETAERAYSEHFAKASRTLGHQDAAKAAAAYTQGQIREKFDFVRFNGRVFPVPLSNVAGGMPDAMRWGPNMEEDMKAALADPKVNLKPDDVASFIPLTLPTASGNRTGWAIVLRDNTLVRNDLGIPLLVTPTPEQERRNIEYRKRAAKYKQGWNWVTGYGVSGAAQRIADDVTGTKPL